jgi:urea transporter
MLFQRTMSLKPSASLLRRPLSSPVASVQPTSCRLLSSSSSSTTSPAEKKDRGSIGKADVFTFVETAGRGIGQVIFLNSPTSGAVLLGGLAVGSPYLASLAALGTVAANGTARLANLDSESYHAGLWGYNGCLVGCAMAVFGPTNVALATTSTLIGAAATPFVAASLKEAMSIPQWTIAFNVVTLSSLLRTQPLLSPLETTETVAEIAAAPTTGCIDILVSPLVGLSQIFVVESALAGTVITAGVMNYSNGLAAHALVGSALGSLVGLGSGAEVSEVAMGLWGFNSALTSMAVGTFFVHSTPAIILSVGGAASTAVVFGAMKTLFSAWGAPCLTLPFCTTMSACYLLHKQIPGLQLAKDPHSPEKNTF